MFALVNYILFVVCFPYLTERKVKRHHLAFKNSPELERRLSSAAHLMLLQKT